MGGNLLRSKILEMKLQAARQNGGGQFLWIGGGENKFNVRRRFFQGFQERIKAAFGKHMHFVNQIDFIASFHRRIGHVIKQIARIIHAGARGGIYFNQIGKTSTINFQAMFAAPAGMAAHALFKTIQRFGKDARNRGFAHAAGAGKEIGMMEAIIIQCISQCFCHMLLANQFVKIFRSPLPG